LRRSTFRRICSSLDLSSSFDGILTLGWCSCSSASICWIYCTTYGSLPRFGCCSCCQTGWTYSGCASSLLWSHDMRLLKRGFLRLTIQSLILCLKDLFNGVSHGFVHVVRKKVPGEDCCEGCRRSRTAASSTSPFVCARAFLALIASNPIAWEDSDFVLRPPRRRCRPKQPPPLPDP
jgi:hypothetical protein